MKDKIVQAFLLTSWVPVFLFFFFWAYLNSLDGWSAWAAASIMSIPITFSAIYALIGLVLVAQSIKRKNFSLKLTLSTLFTGCPILWFLIRTVV